MKGGPTASLPLAESTTIAFKSIEVPTLGPVTEPRRAWLNTRMRELRTERSVITVSRTGCVDSTLRAAGLRVGALVSEAVFRTHAEEISNGLVRIGCLLDGEPRLAEGRGELAMQNRALGLVPTSSRALSHQARTGRTSHTR